ncbi:hypothetical protein [Marinilactibacillus kalidii]|uniref:hypothetical protein n=1 Tax=Marinilactibacillus kalidii TaxID=2820274 RepID=UPI001ABDCFD4|nr:hypothetical protein [Marinilactibacillus kalidii]
MDEEIYTKEQELEVLEKTYRRLGYYLNHNYFVAERGVRPYFQWYLNWSGYVTAFLGFDYLYFAENHLLILKMKFLQDNSEKYIFKIDYKNITDFSVSRPIIKYCLQFKAEGKQYYYYIDASGSYSFNGPDYSARNFNYLLENHFKGLLK